MIATDVRAELRDYYSAVASERAVDGELEKVIAATAGIQPRRGWQVQFVEATQVLRMPMAGGLRLITWLALLLLMLAALAAGIGLASRPSSPAPAPGFEGTWFTQDVADGSRMQLVVQSGKSPAVRFEDFYASSCVNADDVGVYFLSVGQGAVKNKRLTVNYPDGGGCMRYQVEPYEDIFVLDEASDTITDQLGNVWERADD